MLGIHALPLQINIGAEDDFQGVVDLINFKVLFGMKKIRE